MRETRKLKFWSGESGVTLVEVIVALTILATSLGAVYFVLVSNVTSADALRNNTVATGLTQEGLEIVRNLRDREYLTSTTFGNNLPNGTYEVEWSSVSLDSNTNSFLRRDSGTGLFGYSVGDTTIFKRTITVDTISANEKRINVTVTWNDRSGARSLQAESHLYNWF